MLDLVSRFWRRRLLLKIISRSSGRSSSDVICLYRLALEVPPINTPNKGQDKPL